MSERRCPRLDELEAAHDGRLEAAQRAVLAEHTRHCEPCRRRAAALAALGPLLAALPVPARDPFASRRGRHRLLAAAAAAPPVRRRRTAVAAIGGLVAVALLTTAAVALVARARPAATAPAAAPPAPPLDVASPALRPEPIAGTAAEAPAPPPPRASEEPRPLRPVEVARPARPALRSSAASEFRTAVRLFDGGEFAVAGDAFRGFLVRHPDDSRAEDAAYLLTLALHELGDAAAARVAARDYLARYPDGFRRAEVAALAD